MQKGVCVVPLKHREEVPIEHEGIYRISFTIYFWYLKVPVRYRVQLSRMHCMPNVCRVIRMVAGAQRLRPVQGHWQALACGELELMQ